MRVVEGVLRALKTGMSQELAPFARSKRIDTSAQEVKLSAQKSPELVNTSNPGKGKVTKNRSW